MLVWMSLTCPGKLSQFELEFSRNVNEKTEHEEEPFYGRADHRNVEAVRCWREDGDLCREGGISAATFYAWKSKYSGMDVAEAQRLKGLDDENRRLKQLVADLSLDREVLKSVIRKNGWSFAGLRADVAFARAEHGLSERKACKLLEVDRSSYVYEPRPDRNAELREELLRLARQNPRYGYRRLHVLLERRGHAVNLKRVYQLYVEEPEHGQRLHARVPGAGGGLKPWLRPCDACAGAADR